MYDVSSLRTCIARCMSIQCVWLLCPQVEEATQACAGRGGSSSGGGGVAAGAAAGLSSAQSAMSTMSSMSTKLLGNGIGGRCGDDSD